MTTPSNAIQAAIHTRLTSFAALQALVGSNIFDYVPATTQSPYVVIGDDTETDDSTKDRNGWDMTVTIHSWDYEKKGRKSVKAIMGAIYDALHRQEANIVVAGFNLIMLQSEFATSFQDTVVQGQGDQFYHGVQRFRILIHQ